MVRARPSRKIDLWRLAMDALSLWLGSTSWLTQSYLMPLAIELPMWLGLRGWARRIRATTQG
jgi:hypothetical protein